MAIFDNDLGSCYDRILVNLVMVCARRMCMPVESVLAHSETLRQMKYTVKTVYGISENHYCGTASHPLAGTGKGSGAFPAVWLTICAVTINAYCLAAPRKMKFIDPTGTTRSERSVDAFVDDTSVAGLTDYPGDKPMSALTMLKLLEKCAKTWQKETLELSKCYYYMIQWHWDSQGYPKMTEFRQNLDNSGRKNCGSGEYQNKSVRNSSKVLGVMIPVNDDWNDEINRLASKSDNHARLTMSHRHRQCDADLSHRAIWATQHTYSLPITSISKKSFKWTRNKHLLGKWDTTNTFQRL